MVPSVNPAPESREVHWVKGVAPEPPYYASIFSTRKMVHRPGYAEMDEATMKAAAGQDGHLGHQVVHDGDRTIFISYWRDMDAIRAWGAHALHRQAKEKGRTGWYAWYRSEIVRVEHATEFLR
ncbi:MAG: antibiotic biosynthesis monooxygenase [Flavobacteriales bacterium]|nr:antibiotic biosynthesis monooxygenase [Flavobacteriales bacterium]MCB9193769.1 antibiotic biosynthesis monooxygenase [Flavobacteriales bacterium]